MPEEPNPNSLQPGTLLSPDFEVIGPIGTAHARTIYLCRHTTSDKKVVIKCLRTNCSKLELRRLHNEVKCLGLVTHPNVEALLDFKVTPPSLCFIVTEYIEGEPLSTILQNVETLPLNRFKHLFGQACHALSAVHAAGVMHGDIKPTNFLISCGPDDSEQLSLIDFSAAKIIEDKSNPRSELSVAGEIVGTPYYMSPEQCMGMEFDHRADIYSLGCCMYEAITGFPPFKGGGMIDTMSRHISELPRLPIENKPEFASLEYVLSRCLEKNPEDRFQSAAEVRQSIVGNPPKSKPSELLRGLDKRI